MLQEEVLKAEQKREKERAKLVSANPHLIAYDNKGGASIIAAKNIRKELKAAFPGIKFSVRSDASAVEISWINGPIMPNVEEIVKKYQYGYYNGMEDLYEYHRTAWHDAFGGVKFVCCSRAVVLEKKENENAD